jgi:hypothetical protein
MTWTPDSGTQLQTLGLNMVDLKARQRAKQLASQVNLSALANDTKWKEFFSAVTTRKVPLEIKLLDGPEVFPCETVWSPSPNYVEGGAMGPYLFVYVEYVSSSNIDELLNIAGSVGMECIVEGNKATVYGYR